MRHERFFVLAVVFLLSVICTAVSAQTCRSDIASTASDSRFTDLGDGTVSDSATGLMWKQCAEGLSGAGCASGTVGTFTWQYALQQAAGSRFAGYTDWRLPNINELESLVERRCYAPALNAAHFPNTPSYYFWSSSPCANYSETAWFIDFKSGLVLAPGLKRLAVHVRLVRGGQ